MELLGMLQHMATWKVLCVVALLDVVCILLHVSSPPAGVHPLFTLFSVGGAPHDPHERLLQQLQAERRKVLTDMLQTTLTLRNASRTLQLSAQVLAAVDTRLLTMENTLRHLRDLDA